MSEKFKILANFIKDMSSETPDVKSYLFVKDNISKYHLNIDINSKPLKNKMIEVNIISKFILVVIMTLFLHLVNLDFLHICSAKNPV